MCPSFQVTREEEHSTRGRARLLFEMLNGHLAKTNWKSEEVKHSLDLCLSCKACRSECPVGVDMAAYKAEFLSHYYDGRSRPFLAYAMGFVHRWSAMGSMVPSIANFFLQHAPFNIWLKSILGIAQERRVPRFASQSFRDWFHKRKSPKTDSGSRKIVLWVDTFHNYFYPEAAKAAVEVLEFLGFNVIIPAKRLCCGRPLYEFGMLDSAQKMLRSIISDLAPEINEGIPVVGLEPGCLSVFRDEILNLFPEDDAAQRLSAQTFLLSEFLDSTGIELPRSNREVIVHIHCHQRSVMDYQAEERILKRLGLEFTVLDSGCCGMAGAFGFEKEHYDVSMKCGERILFPAVRSARDTTLILTNGFSCREQIRQGTGRRAVHLSEVLKMALLNRV